MADKDISMVLSDTLELEYLVEEISDGKISVGSEPSTGATDLSYISRDYGVFNPTETGTYTLNINNQTVEISVSNIVDNFEDGDISKYSVVDSAGNVNVTSNAAFEGSFGIEFTGSGGPQIQSTSGLDNYPSSGDTYSVKFNMVQGPQSGAIENSQIFFGVQSLSDFPNSYNIETIFRNDGNDDEIKLRDRNGSGVIASDTTLNLSLKNWYTVRTSWGKSGDISVELLDGDTTVTTISTTDTSYSDGGIGFGTNSSTSGDTVELYFDDAKLL